MIRRVMLLLVVTLLAAPPAAAGDTLCVLLVGDSTTVSKRSEPGVKYADWVALLLAESYDGSVDVINAGGGGATVREGRKALAAHADRRPDAIVVSFGLNDAFKLSPAEFRTDYEGLIADASRLFPDARLLVATSTPFDERHEGAGDERFREGGGLDAYLEKHYVQTVRQLAHDRDLPLVDQHKVFDGASAESGKREELVRPDGVH